MSTTKHSPVSLGAGSYDYDALKSGLGEAARGSNADYESKVQAAIEGAATNVHAGQDARTIPGYEFQEVENPELGVKESVQVFVAVEGDAPTNDQAPVQGGAGETAPEPAPAKSPARSKGTTETVTAAPEASASTSKE